MPEYQDKIEKMKTIFGHEFLNSIFQILFICFRSIKLLNLFSTYTFHINKSYLMNEILKQKLSFRMCIQPPHPTLTMAYHTYKLGAEASYTERYSQNHKTFNCTKPTLSVNIGL